MIKPPAELAIYRDPIVAVTRSTEAQIAQVRALKIQNEAQRAALESAAKAADNEWAKVDILERRVTEQTVKFLDSAREVFRPAKAAFRDLKAAVNACLAAYQISSASQTLDGIERTGSIAGAIKETRIDSPWQYEIVNVGLLPREFVLPNLKTITGEMVRQVAEGGAPAIPGVRFFRTKGKK